MTAVPTWLQLACSLQPPRPSWHRSTTGGGRRALGQGTVGGGRGVGPPPLLTCACAAVPFVAQAALTAVASAAHGLGCAGWSAHRLQLCPPGPTPHIQVSGCPPGLPSIRVCNWGTHWCVQGGHKHRAHSPSCTSQRGPVQPSSQKQEPEPPRPSSQRPWEVQLQAGERDRQDGVGTQATGVREQGRAGQHSLPWHRGPKAPGAQSSQAVPVKCAWHLHSPLPLMPSMHVPRWLQGLLAPPGQARGGGEERGEVRPRHEPSTCSPSPDTLHPPPSGSGGSGTSSPSAQPTSSHTTYTPPLLRTLSPAGPPTPSPLLCSQLSWGLGGQSAESAASGCSPRHLLP